MTARTHYKWATGLLALLALCSCLAFARSELEVEDDGAARADLESYGYHHGSAPSYVNPGPRPHKAYAPPRPCYQVLTFDDRNAASFPILNDEPTYAGFRWGGDDVFVVSKDLVNPTACDVGPSPNGYKRGVASLPNAIDNDNGNTAYFCDGSALGGTGGPGFVVTELAATPAWGRFEVTFTGYGPDGVATGSKAVTLDYTGPNIVKLAELGRIYALSWVADLTSVTWTCRNTGGGQVTIDDIKFERSNTPPTPVTCPILTRSTTEVAPNGSRPNA